MTFQEPLFSGSCGTAHWYTVCVCVWGGVYMGVSPPRYIFPSDLATISVTFHLPLYMLCWHPALLDCGACDPMLVSASASSPQHLKQLVPVKI